MFLIGILLAANVHAEQNKHLKTDQFIKKNIQKWMSHNDVPGVAVELFENGTPHAYYFGIADRETKQPITQNTIFEAGSLTKLFTCLLLAKEINAGEMELDDSITKYLPATVDSPKKPFNKITLENLATHTSGLPFMMPPPIKNKSQLHHYFSSWKPSAVIGTQWAYSNLGIGLLGNVLEAKNQQSIDKLYWNKILKPLEMEPIGTVVSEEFMENYAQGYTTENKPNRSAKNTWSPAAGSLKMSAVDALEFLRAAIGRSDVPSDIAQAMRMTQTPYVITHGFQQGLGWVINSDPTENREALLHPAEDLLRGPIAAKQLSRDKQLFDGDALIDKTGGTDGFRSYIAVIPNKKSGIVILANRFVSTGEITRIGREILFNLTDNN